MLLPFPDHLGMVWCWLRVLSTARIHRGIGSLLQGNENDDGELYSVEAIDGVSEGIVYKCASWCDW